jgi:hypothetical protein
MLAMFVVVMCDVDLSMSSFGEFGFWGTLSPPLLPLTSYLKTTFLIERVDSILCSVCSVRCCCEKMREIKTKQQVKRDPKYIHFNQCEFCRRNNYRWGCESVAWEDCSRAFRKGDLDVSKFCGYCRRWPVLVPVMIPCYYHMHVPVPSKNG